MVEFQDPGCSLCLKGRMGEREHALLTDSQESCHGRGRARLKQEPRTPSQFLMWVQGHEHSGCSLTPSMACQWEFCPMTLDLLSPARVLTPRPAQASPCSISMLARSDAPLGASVSWTGCLERFLLLAAGPSGRGGCLCTQPLPGPPEQQGAGPGCLLTDGHTWPQLQQVRQGPGGLITASVPREGADQMCAGRLMRGLGGKPRMCTRCPVLVSASGN